MWRLIESGAADGATNMAVDEALLESVAAGNRPTLRFYQWQAPCLSLGYSQSSDLVRQPHRWEVVRRMTGGRAVLHQPHHHELTYSLTIPADDWRVRDGVLASYRRVSRGLAAGLREMGVTLDASKQVEVTGDDVRTGVRGSAACFDLPSASEIVVGGRKLIGSAQTRRRGVVLQHGALPLCGDVSLIVDGLYFDSDEEREQLRRQLRHQATTLTWVYGCAVSVAAVIDHLTRGLATELDVTFQHDELTDQERARVEELCIGKYGNINSE